MIRVVAIIISPLFFLFFTYQFTNHHNYIKYPATYIFMGLSILSAAMMITNDKHGLFFQEIRFEYVEGYFFEVEWVKGPVFWFQLLLSYGQVSIGFYYLLKKAYSIEKALSRQIVVIALGVMVPLIGNAITLFPPFLDVHLYFDVLGFTAGNILLVYAIWRMNLFEVAPIALRLLVDTLMDGIIVVNHQNRIIDINMAALSFLNESKENVLNGLITDHFSDQVRNLLLNYSKHTIRLEWQKKYQQSKVKIFDLLISPILSNDRHLGFLFTMRDITEQKRLENKLQEFAITDALTGIFNHRHFYELYEKEYNRAIRKEHPLSLVMFDLDHFKQINDTYGHLAGDQILKEVSMVCKGLLRTYDVFARYGGEEFIIILPETNSQEAAALAERLRTAIEDHKFHIEDYEVDVTISLGVSSLQSDQEISSEELIEYTDRALYDSKREGRNRVTISNMTNADQLTLL